MRTLPFLNIFKRFIVSPKSSILDIVISYDKRYLLCGCADGELAVLTHSNI
jgi:hypothetical protein